MKQRSRRIKPVLCPMCEKEETTNLSGVCSDCHGARDYGVKMLKAAATAKAGLEFAVLPDSPNLFPNREIEDTGAFQMGDLGRRIGELLYQLAGVTPTHTIPGGYEAVEKLLRLNDKDRSFSRHGQTCALRAGSMVMLQEIVTAIQDYAGVVEREGYEKGHDLIGRLAEGSLSLNDLHEAELGQGARGRRRQ